MELSVRVMNRSRWAEPPTCTGLARTFSSQGIFQLFVKQNGMSRRKGGLTDHPQTLQNSIGLLESMPLGVRTFTFG